MANERSQKYAKKHQLGLVAKREPKQYFQMIQEDTTWTKDELSPLFWTDFNGQDEEGHPKFDPSVRGKLLKIALDFYQSLDLPMEIKDVHLTGSLANYNYNDHSDLDVHIIIDFDEFPIYAEESLLKELLDSKRWIWNKRHNITVRGFEVELYVQDVKEPHNASGLYSLMQDKWISFPPQENPTTDPKDVDMKALSFEYEIDRLQEEINNDPDPTRLDEIYDEIAEIRSGIIKMRRGALSDGGSIFSVENLAFKKLRNDGYLEKVIDLSSEIYDKIYSVNESKSPMTIGKSKLMELFGGDDLGHLLKQGFSDSSTVFGKDGKKYNAQFLGGGRKGVYDDDSKWYVEPINENNLSDIDSYYIITAEKILNKIPKSLQVITGCATVKDIIDIIDSKKDKNGNYQSKYPSHFDLTIGDMYEKGSNTTEAADYFVPGILVLLNAQAGAM